MAVRRNHRQRYGYELRWVGGVRRLPLVRRQAEDDAPVRGRGVHHPLRGLVEERRKNGRLARGSGGRGGGFRRLRAGGGFGGGGRGGIGGGGRGLLREGGGIVVGVVDLAVAAVAGVHRGHVDVLELEERRGGEKLTLE